MNVRDIHFPVPAALEFAARISLAAKRRLRPSSGGIADEGAPTIAAAPGDPEALTETLARLGIRRGECVMVHSDSAAVERLGWSHADLIDFLIDYLGPEGTLAMPSHPRLFLENGREVYDVRRSPSTVGLLTEIFRRRKGVVRSSFPLSAAAAIGPHAIRLTEGHADSFAPHDEHSPYARLADAGGKALCIGCPLDRMTILHVAEDVSREELRIPEFYETREILVRQGSQERLITVRSRAPWLWWYLCLGRWTYHMYRGSLARDCRISGVTLRAADGKQTLDWMKAEIRAGRSIYPLAWLNRWLHLRGPMTKDGE